MNIKKTAKHRLVAFPSKKVSTNFSKANSLQSQGSVDEFSDSGLAEDFASPQMLNKNSILKKIHTLREIGFGSLIESTADSACNSNDLSSRKFSIGISDFWTGKHRQQFLRDQGYREAFDTLKKKVLISDLARVASLRRPSLPHVMDSNTRKRSVFVRHTARVNTEKVKTAKNSCFSSRNAEKINEGIDLLIDKCDHFAADNLKLKNIRQIAKKEFKEYAGGREKIKRKVTRHEKNMIAAIAYSMAY